MNEFRHVRLKVIHYSHSRLLLINFYILQNIFEFYHIKSQKQMCNLKILFFFIRTNSVAIAQINKNVYYGWLQLTDILFLQCGYNILLYKTIHFLYQIICVAFHVYHVKALISQRSTETSNTKIFFLCICCLEHQII